MHPSFRGKESDPRHIRKQTRQIGRFIQTVSFGNSVNYTTGNLIAQNRRPPLEKNQTANAHCSPGAIDFDPYGKMHIRHLCVTVSSHVIKPAFWIRFRRMMQPVFRSHASMIARFAAMYALPTLDVDCSEKRQTQMGQVHLFSKTHCLLGVKQVGCLFQHCPTQAVSMVLYKRTYHSANRPSIAGLRRMRIHLPAIHEGLYVEGLKRKNRSRSKKSGRNRNRDLADRIRRKGFIQTN